MSPNPPDSRKDRALELLEQIRTELEQGAINNATLQSNALQQHLQEWNDSTLIQTARQWLEDALKGDLIAFDIATAQQHIEKWSSATSTADGDIPEVQQYREQIERRTQQKRDALQIQGVIAHCDSLLQQAQAAESGDDPPHPDFMRRQYFDKALHAAQSVYAEYKDNATLEQLLQRVERAHHHQAIAANIFSQALQDNQYDTALHNLDQLPASTRVPRFTLTTQSSGENKLNYEGRVTQSQAREELMRLASVWANTTAQQAIQSARQQLDLHQPEAALEALSIGDDVRRYLDAEQRGQLNTLESTVRTTLNDMQTAIARAEQAKTMAEDDPVAAWDAYTEAKNTYKWATGLSETQQAIIKAMRSRLRQLLTQVDEAFEARDMNRIRTLHQQAKTVYSDKDPSLDELLQRLDEYTEMADRYDDYISSGNDILNQVRDLLLEDAVGANDLLSQVESYPDIVLEAFNDLYDLRARVNQRLNADQRYSEVYPALFDPNIETVREAINKTTEARDEFKDDLRFASLLQALQFHMAYLSAQQQAQNGNIQQAQQLLTPVLNQPNHPDFSAAQQLMSQIRPPSSGNDDTQASTTE